MPGKSSQLGARLEEYLEAIYLLCIKDRPRVRELARRLNVKPSTVIAYLKKLSEKGYIIYEKGGKIRLTEKGLEIAEKIYEKHRALKEFLIKIGVPEEIAEEDACVMEHYLHPETLEKLREIANKLG